MEPTLILKNKSTEFIAKLFYRVYELILIGTASSLIINLFFSFSRSVTVVTTFLSFLIWVSQSIMKKIYPFIHHKICPFESSLYRYFVEKSVMKYLSPIIPYIGFLILMKLKPVPLLLAGGLYLLVIYAMKLSFDFLEYHFNYSSFNTEKLETLLKTGRDVPDHILYSRFKSDLKIPGLLEYRFYKENDIPTFGVITQVDSVCFNNNEPEYAHSLEAISTIDEIGIWNQTELLKTYVPIFGVTFTRNGKSYIELAPDSGLHGLL